LLLFYRHLPFIWRIKIINIIILLYVLVLIQPLAAAQNKLCAWRHNYAPALLIPRRAPPSRRNVAVPSHAEYVPMLTAAAALRVKAALSKAAW